MSTAIIWVGVAVLALSALAMRGMAGLERMRVHAMLGTYVATPYRPLPAPSSRWTTRLKDPATWKDMVYLVLMLPHRHRRVHDLGRVLVGGRST